MLVFAGRMQPLKAPHVVLRAAALMIRDDPELARRLCVAFVGGPSGTGRADPDGLTELSAALGISRVVRLEPPCPQPELADWYRAATVVMVPSCSESFGLVAVEAQACGTPVVAASVGGLRTAVRDGVSGILVDVTDPAQLRPRDPGPPRAAGHAGAAVRREHASTPPGSAGARRSTLCSGVYRCHEPMAAAVDA